MMTVHKIWRVQELRDIPGLGVATVRPRLGPDLEIEYASGGEPHRATIGVRAGGQILCSYCTQGQKVVAWCPHIRLAVQRRLDREMIHRARAHGEPVPVIVPIVPSEGVFITAAIRPTDREGEVEVVISVPLLSGEGGRDYHLGFFPDPGLSIADIRRSAIDTLHGVLWDTEVFYPQGDAEDEEGFSPFTSRVFRATLGVGAADDKRGVDSASDAPRF